MVLFLLITLTSGSSVSAETPVCEISGYDMAPKFIYTGEPHVSDLNDILMLQIIFNTSYEGKITLKSITLHRAGRASDSDVLALKIYEDMNHNSEYDIGTDQKISSSTFLLGKSEHTLEKDISPAMGLSLFISIDISENATSNSTVGLDIPDAGYIDCQGASIEFEFPVHSKNSTIYLDTDGDSNPDLFDPDDDNDGYTDEVEILGDSDSKDRNSQPKDTDSDFVPDSIDSDDDNDGVLDKHDDYPKDKTRQKDYTIVVLYSVIALFLIVVMLIVLRMGKPKIPKSALDTEDGEEFKVGKKKSGFSDEIFEDDDDLIEEV
jgi:hypothetical protein